MWKSLGVKSVPVQVRSAAPSLLYKIDNRQKVRFFGLFCVSGAKRIYTKNVDDIRLLKLSISVKEISKKWTMPVRDRGLAYSQLAIFFEDKFAAWRLLRTLPSNSRGLSALGISSEDEEKQQHFCHCSSPFYSAACVGALLSVALFDCIFSIGINLGKIAFTQFIFQTHSRQSETFSYIYWCRLWVKFNPIH